LTQKADIHANRTRRTLRGLTYTQIHYDRNPNVGERGCHIGDIARTLKFCPATVELLFVISPSGLFAASAPLFTPFVAPCAPLLTPFHAARLGLGI
jgi:hypothetical protein